MFHKSNFSYCNAGKCQILQFNVSKYREYGQRKEKKLSINADTMLNPVEESKRYSKVIWILHLTVNYLIDNDQKAEKASSWH